MTSGGRVNRGGRLVLAALTVLLWPVVSAAQEPGAPPISNGRPAASATTSPQAPAPDATAPADTKPAAEAKPHGKAGKTEKDGKTGEVPTQLTARITSPMGRTGEIATVRIV